MTRVPRKLMKGRKGRFQHLTPEERYECGREGGTARWALWKMARAERYKTIAAAEGFGAAIERCWKDATKAAAWRRLNKRGEYANV